MLLILKLSSILLTKIFVKSLNKTLDRQHRVQKK